MPAECMKGKRPHRVPLSRQAVELLRSMPRYEECDLVFPGRKMQPLAATQRSSVTPGQRLCFLVTDLGRRNRPPEKKAA